MTTTNTDPVYITADTAKAALRAAAFLDPGSDVPDRPMRMVIHTMAGFIGADWDLDSALAYVDAARPLGPDDARPAIAWVRDLMGHDLHVAADQDGCARVIAFGVKAPAGTFLP